MREVRYRAKDLVGSWCYGEPHIQCKRPHIHSDINITNYIDAETVCQFTGLYDKNGDEIYEGDIVDWTFFYTSGGLQGVVEKDITLRGVIKWGTAGFVFEVWRNDFENAGWYGISSLNFDSTSDIEIVGNIYDNPELVEQ